MKNIQLNENIFSATYYLNLLELQQSGSEVGRIENTLFNSKIKITPHQIQAALFAFKSPVRKGVILADEVGLGKTIEAGIVIAQTWFEKKGRVLIVSPASLMKQWQEELEEKFNLQSVILDRKIYNSRLKLGYSMPIDSFTENIIICSYQMCANLKDDIVNSKFNLVVIDEAHKLRNVYNENNVTSNSIKYAVNNFKKILLTATPIQNNLMDLYGMCSFIDDDIFGDKDIFKFNYIKNYTDNIQDLEYRLQNILHRTLRTQVNQYIKFTKRIPKTFEFSMTNEELEVYNGVRKLLEVDNKKSYLIPLKQRHLLEMILCKLLGSSIYSVSFTLEKMKERLINIKNNGLQDSIDDFTIYDDILDDEDFEISEEKEDDVIDFVTLNKEIEDISLLIEKAKKIKNESKFSALIESLKFSFKYLRENNIPEKVLIFTESRRTQEFLIDNLKKNDYEDVLLYNGQNNSDESKLILKEWLEKPSNTDKKNNSNSINMKSAIVDKFKHEGKILIATEAGAEGLNLQFCSLVINYDLPWNPQRVEQRIGRCHRIGQLNDVVVINFVSYNNLVEQRIYELLNSKFRLFNEILGSSDTILGSLEDGKDIERAILNIYKTCRTTEEINLAFDELQNKYKDDINSSLEKTKKELLENFEEDLQVYFSDLMTETSKRLSEIENRLLKIILAIYGDKINLYKNGYSFDYNNNKYSIINTDDEDYIRLNLNSPFTQNLFSYVKENKKSSGHIVFNISDYQYNIELVKQLIGKKCLLLFRKLTIDSFEKEEYLIMNGITDDNQVIDMDLCEKLFRLPVKEYDNIKFENISNYNLYKNSDLKIESIIHTSSIENNKYLSEEIARINKWADDKIQSVENDVEKLRNYRKELQQRSDYSLDIKEKENLELEINQIGKKIRTKWMDLADSEEYIEDKRKELIENIKKENKKTKKIEDIFMVSFEVI